MLGLARCYVVGADRCGVLALIEGIRPYALYQLQQRRRLRLFKLQAIGIGATCVLYLSVVAGPHTLKQRRRHTSQTEDSETKSRGAAVREPNEGLASIDTHRSKVRLSIGDVCHDHWWTMYC